MSPLREWLQLLDEKDTARAAAVVADSLPAGEAVLRRKDRH
jgi:hypothetical protein